MATRTRTPTRPQSRSAKSALAKAELLDMYRLMLLSRRIDDKEIQLKRQNKIFFQISGAGPRSRPGRRRQGAAARPTTGSTPTTATAPSASRSGMTPTEMLLSAVGAADDPNSGGRQMPSHWGHKALNIVSQSSPTGTQFLQAVGCAEAWLRYTGVDGHRRASRSRATRSSTAPRATARPAKGSSGRRSTPPATSSCRSSS